MHRREFITLLGGAAASWPLAASAQHSQKMHRVGVLMPTSEDEPDNRSGSAAFVRVMNQLASVSSYEMKFEFKWGKSDPAEIRRLAGQLIQLAPDVLVTSGDATMAPAGLEAQNAGRLQQRHRSSGGRLPELGIEHSERAMQLSPTDFYMFAWQSGRAYADFSCDRSEDALDWASKSLRDRSGYLPAERMVAAAAARSRRTEQAQAAMARLRELEATLRISNLKDQIPYRRSEDLVRFADELTRAGLPA